MSENVLTIPYPEELLLSLKESPDEFEGEARFLLAVKLYELGRTSTGMAARLADMSRVEFIVRSESFWVITRRHRARRACRRLGKCLNRPALWSRIRRPALALIDQLELLRQLYGEVRIPPTVEAEVLGSVEVSRRRRLRITRIGEVAFPPCHASRAIEINGIDLY